MIALEPHRQKGVIANENKSHVNRVIDFQTP